MTEFRMATVLPKKVHSYSWSNVLVSSLEGFPQALRDFMFPYYIESNYRYTGSCSFNEKSLSLGMELNNIYMYM